MEAEIGEYPQHQPFAWRLWAAARAQADVETKGIGDLPVPSVGHWAFGSVVEVKSSKTTTPARRRKAWEQATGAAKETGKRPLIVETYVDGGKRTFWLVQRIDWPMKESE
jgi:hypothetical protein